jgi:hypothetical protein
MTMCMIADVGKENAATAVAATIVIPAPVVVVVGGHIADSSYDRSIAPGRCADDDDITDAKKTTTTARNATR